VTLPSSGTLSLNAIHIEAGGSSGTSCSINDSDIRGLIGKNSGASMNFAEWYGASSFTAETQLVITGANSGVKFANPSFSTYSSGIAGGTLGSAADNQITLDQGQTCVFHQVSVSTFMSIGVTMDFNGSSSAGGGGMSRTDYLQGHYWRTTFSDGTGNPGNMLLPASQAYNLNPTFNFVGQRVLINQASLQPLGATFNVQRTIQVY
tara:strand:+ start:207 stop:824 length:618 start_codon:yes stop_codon:yes gene_type:complete